MIVSGTGTIEDAMEEGMAGAEADRQEMVAMGEAGEVDVLEVGRAETEVAVGAGLTVEEGRVEALPGLLVESQGQEISEIFQTQRQTRGPTHIPREWEFRRIAGGWNRWSQRIHAPRTGREGR